MNRSNMKKYLIPCLAIVALAVMPGCKKQKSSTTGQGLNSSKWGGFEKHEYPGQETGPGLVLVEGGTFVMGSHEQNVIFSNDNLKKRVTVQPFYMDETEVSNHNYREYLYWIGRVFVDMPEVFRNALPDTNVWRSKLAYNEPFVEYYFRHPAYQDYPVVGVNWLQATDYAAWRTDRVNEYIMDREKIIKYNSNAEINEENFNSKAYLAGQYDFATKGRNRHQKRDYTKKKKFLKKKSVRNVTMEDGILLPEYRLPTEAEWEYAAMAGIGNSQLENIDQGKIYPWNDLTVRWTQNNGATEKVRGLILANFKRGKGDQGGIAGKLNDAGFITTPVFSYWPNDYGLYNMAGNVSEWTMDVYRPLSSADVNDFNSFRGNVYKQLQFDQFGELELKDSLGRLKYELVDPAENVNRRNYRVADNIGFKDELSYYEGEQQYEYGVTSLVDNQARVYKGGSWNDRAYWLSPGTKRYLDEQLALSTLGFRCAMIRFGAPIGNSKKKFNTLPSSGIGHKRKKRR